MKVLDKNLEALMIDSAVMRTHLYAAGPQKSRRSSHEALQGRVDRIKIHTAVDALGNLLRCLPSGGQVTNVTYAQSIDRKL